MEEAAAANADKGTNQQKVGDFWRSAMDEEGLEKRDGEELVPILERVDAITDVESLAKTIAWLQSKGLVDVFSLDAEG